MDSLKPITPQALTPSQATELVLPRFRLYSEITFQKPQYMATHYTEEIQYFREQCKRRGTIDEGEVFIKQFLDSDEGKAYKAEKIEMARAELWGSVSVSGVPERYRDKVFSTYETNLPGQKKALDAVKAIAENDASAAMLVLYGPPGTGKTHLGVSAVYDRYIRRGCWNGERWAIFTTQALISRRVRDTYGDDSKETEKKVMADFSTCSLLVVDEIGAGSGSDHEKQMLCDVLCSRYNAKRPTIMISNLGVDGLKAALGDRVIDRINEDSGSGFLPMAWASQRAAQKVAK